MRTYLSTEHGATAHPEESRASIVEVKACRSAWAVIAGTSAVAVNFWGFCAEECSITTGAVFTPPATITVQHCISEPASAAADIGGAGAFGAGMASAQQAIVLIEQLCRTSVNPEFATKSRRTRIRPITRICRLWSMLKYATIYVPLLSPCRGWKSGRFKGDYTSHVTGYRKDLSKARNLFLWTGEEELHCDSVCGAGACKLDRAGDRAGNCAAWDLPEPLAGEVVLGRVREQH